MNRSIPIFSLWLVMLVCLGPAARPVYAADSGHATEDATTPVWRLYPVHYLDLRAAGLLVESRIPEMLMQDGYQLRYEGTGPDGGTRGYLRVLTDPASHARIAQILAEADQPLASHLFHLVLLAAVDDSTAPPDLPPGAAEALADLKDLLPFKGYRLIDSALVRSVGRSEVSLSANYELGFTFRVGPSQDKPLEVERFVLYSASPDGTVTKHMETTFSADIGETVVVGTSTPRDSRQALVVLMTALE